MPNDELKKRIKEILRKRMAELLGSCHTDEVPFDEKSAAAIMFYADEFADALIAAGIGDVAKEKDLRESAESFYMKKCKECSSISKELRQSKHHAARAERALQIADELGELCGRKEDYVQQAEKELQEEKKSD